MLGTVDDFTIMRLRVKGSNLDPLAVRPRLQNLIGEISLRPLLPESASLFIRKLEDPAPGLLRLEAIDSRATQTWRRSLNSRFEQLVISAARPARGPVSNSAESVLFLDHSELLACLTADWCNGFVGARWWWHSFLQRGDIGQVVKKLWREKIEYVPAAMQQLARRHVLVEFVVTLSDRESRDLVERLAEKFALPAIKKVVESLDDLFWVETGTPASISSSPSVGVAEKQIRSIAPWRHVVPESDAPRLRPMQQLFLGVALMIKRAPSQVRMQSFAREVERWQNVVLVGASVAAADEIPGEPEVDVELFQPPIKVDERVNADNADQERIEDVSVEVVRPEPLSLVSAAVDEGADGDRPSVDLVMELPIPSIVEPPPLTDRAPQSFVAELEESLTIDTELGGLFYLINLGIFLNIYSDFTSPVETFTEVNIWDFVTLVGCELNEQQNDDDPIWSLLADLAARDEEQLPEETLTWVSRLMPSIRERLNRALGLDDLAEVVIRHCARVTVTATHLDVFFSLADLPIEIRLSGLDRDPGWVPAAGRFIAFHFD